MRCWILGAGPPRRLRFSRAALCVIVGLFPQLAHAQVWPAVVAQRDSLVVNKEPRHATWTFRDAHGNGLYRLTCVTFGYQGDPDFEYSGDFECRLTSLVLSPYSTLLTDNPHQSRDWESRGRFLADELVGSCARYPEYGAVRHFRLRAMRITLSLTDIVFDKSPGVRSASGLIGLSSFRFAFSVVPDSTAHSEIAELSGYEQPPYLNSSDSSRYDRDCSKVLRAPDR